MRTPKKLLIAAALCLLAGPSFAKGAKAKPEVTAVPTASATPQEENVTGDSFDGRTVDAISVEGNAKTRSAVILREVPIAVGDRLTKDAMLEGRRRLRGLGFFEAVDFMVKETPDADRVHLIVRVKEVKTGNLSLGLGYQEDMRNDRLLGVVGLSQSNLAGLGIGASLDLLGGKDSYGARWDLRFPGLGGSKTALRHSAWFERLRLVPWTLGAYGGSLGLERRIDPKRVVGVDYVFCHDRLSELNTGYRFSGATEGDTSALAPFAIMDTRDDFFFPRRGFRQDSTVLVAGLGGDSKYWLQRTRDQFHVPLTGRLSMRLRTEIATGSGLRSRDTLPLFAGLRLGGIDSVRGFREGQLGVTDYQGGGLAAAWGAEVRYQAIRNHLELAAFSDGGNVWGDLEHARLKGIKPALAVGGGVRYRLPKGGQVFELYYGAPLSYDRVRFADIKGEGCLHFNLGIPFNTFPWQPKIR